MANLKLKFTDNASKTTAEVERLFKAATDGKEKWSDEKLLSLNELVATLLNEPTDFVMCLPGKTDGELVLTPGYKIDLLLRVLKGEQPLPKRRENVFA